MGSGLVYIETVKTTVWVEGGIGKCHHPWTPKGRGLFHVVLVEDQVFGTGSFRPSLTESRLLACGTREVGGPGFFVPSPVGLSWLGQLTWRSKIKEMQVY